MTDPTAEVRNAVVQSIAVDKIHSSPYQARKDFNKERIEALASSMKLEGLIQPITVRQVGEGYELIGGERRLRSAKLLGWTEIEAKVVQPVSEGDAAAKGLVENLQREDLNPIEEAEGFDRLNKIDKNYWTHERIAEATGKDRTYVTRSIGLLGLPDEIIENVRQGTLTRKHGVELLRINNAKEQKRLAKKVGKKGLTVEQLRGIIDKKQGKIPSPPAPKNKTDMMANPGWQFTLNGNQLSAQGLITLESGQDPMELLAQSILAAFAAWATGGLVPTEEAAS